MHLTNPGMGIISVVNSPLPGNALTHRHSIHTLSMEQKNITTHDKQAEWVEQMGLNLSQFVQSRLDEAMRDPSDDELAVAYAENAEQARETNREWAPASKEATERLGEPSEMEDPE